MIPLTLGEIATIVGGKVHPAVGAEGEWAADELATQVVVTAPAVLDGRKAEPGALFVAFAGEHSDGHAYAAQAGVAGAVAVLGSRPTALPTVVVDDAEAALQALAAELLARLRATGSITVVGITGSQGKTSTKDMIDAVLSANAPTVATLGSLNNELGVPLTVLRATAETRYLVLEMGARGRGHIAQLARIAPLDVALVLNVGFAHLGEFGSREAIALAKGELVEGLVPGGVAVLNADDPRVVAMRALHEGAVTTYGEAEHANVRARDLVLDRLGRPQFTLSFEGSRAEIALGVVGAHQMSNAAAATAVAVVLGLDLDAVVAPLKDAKLSQWRMELHESSKGVVVLNDSYNANPDSMRAALDALATITVEAGERRIAVLGEMRELGEASDAEHAAIGAYAAERADVVLVVAHAALATGAGERAKLVADNVAAIDWLRANSSAGDVVLVKASRGARLDEVAAGLE